MFQILEAFVEIGAQGIEDVFNEFDRLEARAEQLGSINVGLNLDTQIGDQFDNIETPTVSGDTSFIDSFIASIDRQNESLSGASNAVIEYNTRISQLDAALADGSISQSQFAAGASAAVDVLERIEASGATSEFAKLEAEAAKLENRFLGFNVADKVQREITQIQTALADTRIELSPEAIAGGTARIEQLQAELDSINTDPAERELKEFIAQVSRSDAITQLETRLEKLQGAIANAGDAAPAFTRDINRTQAALNTARASADATANSLNGITNTGAGNFLFQLAFFAQDAQFGLQGIANNIPVLAQGFGQLSANAAAINSTPLRELGVAASTALGPLTPVALALGSIAAIPATISLAAFINDAERADRSFDSISESLTEILIKSTGIERVFGDIGDGASGVLDNFAFRLAQIADTDFESAIQSAEDLIEAINREDSSAIEGFTDESDKLTEAIKASRQELERLDDTSQVFQVLFDAASRTIDPTQTGFFTYQTSLERVNAELENNLDLQQRLRNAAAQELIVKQTFFIDDAQEEARKAIDPFFNELVDSVDSFGLTVALDDLFQINDSGTATTRQLQSLVASFDAVREAAALAGRELPQSAFDQFNQAIRVTAGIGDLSDDLRAVELAAEGLSEAEIELRIEQEKLFSQFAGLDSRVVSELSEDFREYQEQVRALARDSVLAEVTGRDELNELSERQDILRDLLRNGQITIRQFNNEINEINEERASIADPFIADVERLERETRTPLEQFEADVQEIFDLAANSGNLSIEVQDRALQKVIDDMLAAEEIKTRLEAPSLLEFGSVELQNEINNQAVARLQVDSTNALESDLQALVNELRGNQDQNVEVNVDQENVVNGLNTLDANLGDKLDNVANEISKTNQGTQNFQFKITGPQTIRVN